MAYRDLSSQIEESPENSIEERDLARLTVCSAANDPADAAMLLDMLGLMPGQDLIGSSIDIYSPSPFG